MVCISACKAKTQPPPPTPITTLDAAQGGKIVYGTVDGATTQAEAMSHVLRVVHNNCGEKPQIGKVFQFKGTNTVGVFFTVTNHAQNNTPVAGLVISAASGPHQVEAALVTDKASRFGHTVNPMLQQLFGAWTPGGQAAASSSAFGGKTDSAGGQSAPASGHTSGPAQLHTVTLPDRSASVGIPDGWKVDPSSGGGTMGVTGPHGEMVFLNEARTALDLSDPSIHRLQQGGIRPYTTGQIVAPFNVDLTRAYPEILKQWRHLSGINDPLNFQNVHVERMPTRQGEQCVHITGNIVDESKQSTNETSLVLCFRNYMQGNYTVLVFQTLIPVELADRERATAGAIMASFQMNQGVVNQQADAIAAPTIAAIHAVGQQAAADRASRNATYDAQHAGYWAQQHNNDAQHAAWNAGEDNNARNGQGFSNYILDQTVVEDNNMYNNGTVGHGTVYNSTADALIKADPNRFSSVDTPNYWQGTDF
jgi:hypothetical protein